MSNPEHIRILDAPRLPIPDDPLLKQAVMPLNAMATSSMSKGTFGRLPLLTAKAVAWAQMQADMVLSTGRALDLRLLSIAKNVGVTNPQRIRLLEVARLPMPADPQLEQAVIANGLLGPGAIGLTFGYAVFTCTGHEQNLRLLSHEFRHVYQYENAGSIGAFLPAYLQQIAMVGYRNAPLEIDARAHERHS